MRYHVLHGQRMKPDYTQRSDSELYQLLSDRQHREQAFAEIYRRYSHRVFVYCRKIVQNTRDAEDAFQDTFMKFLSSASNTRVMSNLLGYLLSIARNCCMDIVNKRHQHTELVEELHGATTDSSVEQNELGDLITMALELLPFQWREAVVLQLYADMSYEEIAQTLEVPVTTVRNWICRGKQRLREILQPYFDERDVESPQ
jgi:RNA polymerase sigma-70 factor (ECF subfamily)